MIVPFDGNHAKVKIGSSSNSGSKCFKIIQYLGSKNDLSLRFWFNIFQKMSAANLEMILLLERKISKISERRV